MERKTDGVIVTQVVVEVVVEVSVVWEVVVAEVVVVDEVAVDEVVVVPVLHEEMSTPLPSIVTAPVCAKALPETRAPVSKLMLVRARMFPKNDVVVPRVAELPTCQYALHLLPPLIMATDESEAVMRVLAIWKMKSAFGSPCALRVSVPVS